MGRLTGQTVTHPDPNPPAARVPKKNPLPCYVILVHGVNDVGEAYSAQEKGLCWGLAERLDRNYDMKPAEYKIPKREDTSGSAIRRANEPPEPVDPEPEKHCYRRTLSEDTYSPVIPFYWGFREEDGRIKKAKETWHGEMLDRDGNRLDRDGAKNGGPFVNASNCLPHMWAPGWKPPFPGINLFASFSDKTHPLLKATCYRRYQVLAALRLAMLIRIIRKRHPDAAINVVAHSMGCLVALLAQAFLMDEGEAPAHCIVMNNPPYSFEENLLDGRLYEGINQTSRARIETMIKLVKAFKERQAKGPSLKELRGGNAGTGLAGSRWGTKKNHADGGEIHFEERDNRGKIYLYFTPHDRTVAMLNTQGIGWQGVPDDYTAELDSGRPVTSHGTALSRNQTKSFTWRNLLEDLDFSGFRQRLFMLKKREGGTTFQVGLRPQPVSLLASGESYGPWSPEVKSLPVHTVRFVNGEPLSPPIHFDPGPDVLPISPIDAAVALTNGGSLEISEAFDDPRPREERSALNCEEWRALLNRGKPKEQQIPHIICIDVPDDQEQTGPLRMCRTETPYETRYRLQSFGTSENSHHSSIVSNHWHSQAVTAFDLALGRPIPWTEQERQFYDYLCEVADWRITSKGEPRLDKKLALLNANGFYDNEDLKNKELIEATAWYYVKGNLPLQVNQAKTPEQLSLIHFETTGNRSLNLCNS